MRVLHQSERRNFFENTLKCNQEITRESNQYGLNPQYSWNRRLAICLILHITKRLASTNPHGKYIDYQDMSN